MEKSILKRAQNLLKISGRINQTTISLPSVHAAIGESNSRIYQILRRFEMHSIACEVDESTARSYVLKNHFNVSLKKILELEAITLNDGNKCRRIK
jgi:hypothetical protein